MRHESTWQRRLANEQMSWSKPRPWTALLSDGLRGQADYFAAPMVIASFRCDTMVPLLEKAVGTAA